MRTFIRVIGALAVLSGGVCHAQNAPAAREPYPVRPVRIVVPFAAGGPGDLISRLIAQKLSEGLGKQFYVENQGGAGGNIGMGMVARAPADGYTIMIASSTFMINPSLYGKVPYDPIKDFDPVTLAVSTTTVLAIHPSVPAQTTRDLVAVIRANTGKYFSSPGTGTPSHLLGELFRLSLKLDLVHVPFNSGALAIASTLAGHTPLCFGTPPPALPHLKDGKLRALAVTSKARVPTLPDVPTMAEAGYPDVEGVSWFAVAVPAGTPKEIVALLNREIVKIMALPDIKEHLATLGFDLIASSPEEFGARIRADFEKWAKVIRAANIKAE